MSPTLALQFHPKSPKTFLSPLTPFPPTSSRLPRVARSLPRRLLFASASSLWDAVSGNNSPREASLAIRKGMQLFRQGDVKGSVDEFDRAIALDPCQKAYLWQRGLSLYYLDRFEEGAEQFRIDVAAYPNDTEESIWCFLCEAQLYGVEEAREKFLEVGRDLRLVMREAYNMYKNGGDPAKFVSAFMNGPPNEYFYASLYAGLYHESEDHSRSSWVVIDGHAHFGVGSSTQTTEMATRRVRSSPRDRGSSDATEGANWDRLGEFLERQAAQSAQGGVGAEHDCFMRQHPPSFDGRRGPEVAEGWIFRMEKIFRAIGVAPERMVELVTYVFDGEAANWWRSTFMVLFDGRVDVSWEEFLEVFHEQLGRPVLFDDRVDVS